MIACNSLTSARSLETCEAQAIQDPLTPHLLLPISILNAHSSKTKEACLVIYAFQIATPPLSHPTSKSTVSSTTLSHPQISNLTSFPTSILEYRRPPTSYVAVMFPSIPNSPPPPPPQSISSIIYPLTTHS